MGVSLIYNVCLIKQDKTAKKHKNATKPHFSLIIKQLVNLIDIHKLQIVHYFSKTGACFKKTGTYFKNLLQYISAILHHGSVILQYISAMFTSCFGILHLRYVMFHHRSWILHLFCYTCATYYKFMHLCRSDITISSSDITIYRGNVVIFLCNCVTYRSDITTSRNNCTTNFSHIVTLQCNSVNNNCNGIIKLYI